MYLQSLLRLVLLCFMVAQLEIVRADMFVSITPDNEKAKLMTPDGDTINLLDLIDEELPKKTDDVVKENTDKEDQKKADKEEKKKTEKEDKKKTVPDKDDQKNYDKEEKKKTEKEEKKKTEKEVKKTVQVEKTDSTDGDVGDQAPISNKPKPKPKRRKRGRWGRTKKWFKKAWKSFTNLFK